MKKLFKMQITLQKKKTREQYKITYTILRRTRNRIGVKLDVTILWLIISHLQNPALKLAKQIRSP